MEIARQDTLIASLRHDLDSATQSHAKTQGAVKSNVKTWKERIDPVERIAVLINGKKDGDVQRSRMLHTLSQHSDLFLQSNNPIPQHIDIVVKCWALAYVWLS